MNANTVAIALGLLAIVAGILILIFPFLLNYIAAAALIIIGAIVLYQRLTFQGSSVS